jgi:hypothetical protein
MYPFQLSKQAKHTITLLLIVLFPEYSYFRVSKSGIITIKRRWYSLRSIKKGLFELAKCDIAERLSDLYSHDTITAALKESIPIGLGDYLCSLYEQISRYNVIKQRKIGNILLLRRIQSSPKQLVLVKLHVYNKQLEMFNTKIVI